MQEQRQQSPDQRVDGEREPVRDEDALAKETLKDLEPTPDQERDVRGGSNGGCAQFRA